MIRVLVGDDHAIVREGLKQILADSPDMIVTGEASDGQEVLSEVTSGDYDVVVLDISLPGRSGLDVLKQLRIQKPDLPVLVLSFHPAEEYGIRVLRAGASGYLTKESAPEELVAAIRKVGSGRRYISETLAEKLASDLRTDIEKPLHEALSDREYQVMCMISSGKMAKEIAQELSLSEKTISTYRVRILEKMKMHSNAELTYYAIKHELVG